MELSKSSHQGLKEIFCVDFFFFYVGNILSSEFQQTLEIGGLFTIHEEAEFSAADLIEQEIITNTHGSDKVSR